MLLALITTAFASPLNLNAATQSELEDLPGIGPSKARAILEHRAQHGPFSSVHSLNGVAGIGSPTIESLQGLLVVQPNKVSRPKAAEPTDEVPSPTASLDADQRININAADLATLEHLPGLGPAKAAAIITHRESKGPFATCEGLSEIPGFGVATLAVVRERCRTD